MARTQPSNREPFLLTITDLNPDGNGVGRTADGLVVFAPLTAPGDVVQARLIKQTASYGVARVDELLTPSPDRAADDCAVYRRCGGCVYRHITIEAENRLKQSTVENALLRIGHLPVGQGFSVEPTRFFGADCYRNKVVYPLTPACSDGNFRVGYFARRTHEVVPHEVCRLQDERFHEIALFHVEQAQRLGVPFRDETSGSGILRHIAMRKNRAGQFCVCFVASKRFPQAKHMADELMKRFPYIAGVSLNINPAAGNTIFGEQTLLLAGDAHLTDTLCGRTFSLSPTAFYQVNAECTEGLYRLAAELADLPPSGVLLDLYCGVGTIGLSMATPSQRLCGVEIHPQAVKDAQSNAEANGRTPENTLFLCGDASIGVNACRKAFGDPDVIVVDPPRKGLSAQVIGTLKSVAPPRIIYISCNPATLAADVAALSELYNVTRVVPFNMFPRTGHVETVLLLSKKV